MALLLIIGSIVLYMSQGSAQPANGGTMQGYILGTLAALLILLLTYLGIRKRKYASTAGTVEGWTSAHVYLGATLLLMASLHAAFQVGWNVHTLAYALMIAVILSGFYGLFAYMHYPSVLSHNNVGGTQDDWLQELADIDEKIKNLSSSTRGNVRISILSAIVNTRFSGSIVSQIRGKDKSKIKLQSDSKNLVLNTNQDQIIDLLATALPNSINQTEAAALNELLTLFSRRQRLLKIIRRNLQIKAFLRIWLMFHIPLTIALLAALIVHILVVFIYW